MICWRSTSWPTRSSSPDSSMSSWRQALRKRWPTACPWQCGSESSPRAGAARHSRPSASWSSGFSSASGCCVTTTLPAWPASLEQRVPLVDQVLLESVDRLPDRARYWPLGQKAMLRRIGLRGLDPALFERPKSGFVLPFDRWIRRGLKDAMDQTSAGPAGYRSSRARPRSGGAALACLPRRGARHVLVADLVGIRLHPMVPPQPRFPLKRPFGARRRFSRL